MPELPEVETTVRGIRPHIEQHTVKQLVIRQSQLRWPIPEALSTQLSGQTICSLHRRAKYLVFQCDSGFMLIHLGMSGHLQVLDTIEPVGKHDHVDIIFDHDKILRYTDPRRFGAILWSELADFRQHPLLRHLGPEPLSREFSAAYLQHKLQHTRSHIKACLMKGEVVVGVGNIYANEALFLAGIHPQTPARTLSIQQLSVLVSAIKDVLNKAIEAGGTTLKDFRNSDGKPGYFAQQLYVYGRQGHACPRCQTPIVQIRQSQRASYFCPVCQPQQPFLVQCREAK